MRVRKVRTVWKKYRRFGLNIQEFVEHSQTEYFSSSLDHCLNFDNDHIDRDLVLSAARNDDIGPALAWFDELEVHRLHSRNVLMDDRVDQPASFDNISPQTTNEALVRVSVDVDFRINEIAQFLFHINENPFEEDDLLRLDVSQFLLPRVSREIINGSIDRPSSSEFF